MSFLPNGEDLKTCGPLEGHGRDSLLALLGACRLLRGCWMLLLAVPNIMERRLDGRVDILRYHSCSSSLQSVEPGWLPSCFAFVETRDSFTKSLN